MATKVDIINLALARIGNDGITSPDEASQGARVARRVYDMIRDVVLEAFPWNFAVRRGETLAAVSNESTDNWAYAYAYPSTALRVLKIYPPSSPSAMMIWTNQIWSSILTRDPDEWEVAQSSTGSRIIFCSVEQAKVDYIMQVANPALYSPSFVDAFAYRLAAEMALSLAADEQKRANNLNIYRQMLVEAWTNQANERQENLRRPSRYLGAR